MKIKTSQLYKLIIYFFITWDTILLSVFNFNPGGKRYSVMVLSAIAISLMIFVLKRNKMYMDLFKWPKVYALLLSCMLLIHYIYDILINKVNINAFMHNACYYAIFFMAFPMILIIEKDEENFWKFINILMFIWYTWFLVQYLAYQNGGILLAPALKSGELLGNSIRDGSIRLEMKAIAHIAILYNFDQFYNHGKEAGKKRKYNLLMFLYGLFVMVVIEQTRGYFIAIFGAIAVLILCYNRNSKKFCITFCLVIIGIIILLKTNVIGGFLSSVLDSSESYEKGATGLIRLRGMAVFWEAFKRNPLFGLGFQTTGDNAITQSGIFYFNDDGFVGIVGQIGIWAFIIYGMMLLRFTYIVAKLFKIKQYTKGTQLLGFLVYLFLTSISLICYWNTTCMLCPILWAIFEVGYHKGMTSCAINS